jgi:hypothetical protein
MIMEYKTDELIAMHPFQLSQKEKDVVFRRAIMEELCFHYDNNSLYKKFCDKKDFDPHTFNGKLTEIPSVSVSVFKELGNILTSVSGDDIKLTLQSSATSGIPSSVPIDKITAKRQAKVMVKVVQEFIGNERKPFLVMDINPQQGFRQLLGARFAAVSGYLNFACQVGYFLKVNENNDYYFDIAGIRQYIDNLNQSKPVIVFGFTYILYSEIIRPNRNKDISFQLPSGSKIIHIGGWKKLENEKIDKNKFNKAAAELFGIDPKDVIDIYGFTEQMGLNYPDCPCGCKHTSLYSEVIVRDVVTGEVTAPGKEGMLEFLTPVPHSYPGNAILTDDIGIIDDTPCPYNRTGTRFKILGRLKKAEVRGCGDILSNKLKFANNLDVHNSTAKDEALRIEYWRGENVSMLATKELQLKSIINQLNEKKEWIRNQPVDAIIGLISEAAKKWSNTNKLQNELHGTQGLFFLSAWCTPEHLVHLSTIGLRGNRLYMDSFLSVQNGTAQYMRATQRGLVCHWLSGNVQILGIFALVQSILTKNVNLLKVSSNDYGTIRQILASFEDVSFTTKGGYNIKGDDLLGTVAVVYFNRNEHSLGNIMSSAAAARIAWGGREAVQAVSNYTARFDCEDIIFGPKISFSVIAKEKLEDERQIKKLARKVSVDASVFDQTGCASPHNIYVEKGGRMSPRDFAAALSGAMKKTAIQIPKGETSLEQISAIHSIRGIYDFKGEVFAGDDSSWTVLYCEDDKLNLPVYSRVVFVHPVDHINDSIKFIDDDIQTIGLAATGKKAVEYAEKAIVAGAMRLPDMGKMLNFESPWDGIIIMERLVKWNTLGGPVV